MFFGRQEAVIDAKNRLTIPGKFRDKLDPCFLLSYGGKECLEIRSHEVFEKNIREIEELAKPSETDWQLELYANTEEVSIDAQGRILIPRHLLKKCEIGNAVMLVGLRDKIAIYDMNLWNRRGEEGNPKSVQEVLRQYGR